MVSQQSSSALSIISVVAGALALIVVLGSDLHEQSPFAWLIALVSVVTGIVALATRAGARAAAIIGLALSVLVAVLAVHAAATGS